MKTRSVPRHLPPAAQSRAGRRSVFTLFELLVTIAVLLVLASLLFPVLSRARGLACRVACANNLRQIGMASVLYMEDNKGYVVDDRVDCGFFFAWQYARYLDVNPAVDLSGSFSNSKVVTLLKTSRIFQCPALSPDDLFLDYTVISIDHKNSRVNGSGFDYVQPEGARMVTSFPTPPGWAAMPYLVENNTALCRAEPTFGFWDAWREEHLTFDNYGSPNMFPRMIAFDDRRHDAGTRGKTPVVFFDAHLEILDLTPNAMPVQLFSPRHPRP